MRLAQHVRARPGGLDILVNNAGIQQLLDFRAALDFADVERELAINLLAPLHLTLLLLPLLRDKPEAALVNVKRSGAGA